MSHVGRRRHRSRCATLVVAGTVAAGVGGYLNITPSLRWFVARAEPDAGQRRGAGTIVRRQTALLLATWGAGGAALILVNLSAGAGPAILIGVAVLLGGMSTVSTSLLFTQRISRPIVAAATGNDVDSRVTAPGIASRLVMMWLFQQRRANCRDRRAHRVQDQRVVHPATASLDVPIVVLSVVSVLLGLRALILVARSIADPVRDVVDGMAEVEQGRIGRTIDVYEQSEIGRLQRGFNSMVKGLAERDRIRDLFGRHVGHAVVRLAMEGDDSLTGEVREVAILFIDLAGSTTLAATLSPPEVSDILNDFFQIVVPAVDDNAGVINQFQGDAALVVFGSDGAATAALATARALSADLRRLPVVDFGIGVSAGPVFAGNIRCREPLRVHGDRRSRQRGSAPCRLRQDHPRQGHGLRCGHLPRRRRRTRAVGHTRVDGPARTGRSHPGVDPPRPRGREWPTMTTVEPFRIAVPDDVLADLRRRLADTRWPEAECVDDWSQGIPLAYTRELATYWGNDYDWRPREAALNRFDQFTTEIDGLPIHFIHQRSHHPDALALVITHGWPGSIVEFQKVIAPLTDPTAHGGSAQDAFHVVCPSLPGYGFSGKPTATGWNTERIARAWDTLMVRLGYDRYGAQGGDWGAAVTTDIGRNVGRCVGIHTNMPIGRPPASARENPTDEEKAALEALTYYRDVDSGYFKQQATRPQTLGYGLVDSPAAQLAWIIEKFWSWTDCDGHPENALTRDELLDNVTLYWVTATGASSARLYWESMAAVGSGGRVELPTGVASFPKEISRPPRAWCEANYNITHWTTMPRGGHFAAFEQPELWVDDVRAFFATVR